MKRPRVSLIRRFDTHRLVASQYSDDPGGVLGRIAEDNAHLSDIVELDNLTNEGVLAENDLMPGIGVQEMVFGIPHWRVINAAFTYAHPQGSRFNGPNRGAWYAAFEIETSQAEVAFHKTIQLGEIGRFQDEVFYVDYLADFSSEFHDLRNDSAFGDCLAPDSYLRSQTLAEELLIAGSLGIVYPSVRHASGTCLACFRPALVSNVRRGLRYRFTWSGKSTPMIAEQEHIT